MSLLFVVVTLWLRSSIFSNNFEGLLVCYLLCLLHVWITMTTVGSIFWTSPVLGPYSLRTSTVPLPKPCTSQSKVHPFAWSFNQVQKYLRHCTPVAYFGWIGLPMILCLWSPPTPIKVASNIEPCSRLEGTTTLNGREEGGGYFISQTWNHQQFNTRTYTKIHTPTMVQRWRGLMEPLPAVFYMLQYFETILPLVESLWSS